jgi:hypothetical protein
MRDIKPILAVRAALVEGNTEKALALHLKHLYGRAPTLEESLRAVNAFVAAKLNELTIGTLEDEGFVRAERRSPENGNRETWVRREVLEQAADGPAN